MAISPSGFDDLGQADLYLIAWTLSWTAHALVTNPLNLFNANTFFPAPLSLAFSESLLGYVPFFAPIYLITSNPVLALNVMAWLTYPLSAFCMYLYARRSMHEHSALLSGLLYGFCLYRYVSPPHFHMLGVEFLPLILLATEQWVETQRRRDLVLLGAALTLQALNSAYLLYAVLLMYGPLLALILWHHRARLDRQRMVGLMTVGIACGAVLYAAMRPYLVLRSYGLVPSYSDSHTSLGLIPLFARLHLKAYLLEQGVGWIGYTLAAIAIFLGRGAAASWVRQRGLLLVVVGCVAALGPNASIFGVDIGKPYDVLMRVVPGFSTIRLPARFTVIAHLGFSLLAGYGVDVVLRRARSVGLTAAATAMLGLGILSSYRPFPELLPLEVPTGAAIPNAYKWLAVNGHGGALLELPRDADYAGRSRKAYLSSFHWLPIIDGYSANAPAHVNHIYWNAKRLPGEAALQEIVDLIDVRWILLHRDRLSEFERALWRGPLPSGLSVVGEWGSDLLLQVSRPVRDDRRARLISSTETLNGLPIAPVSPDCRGTLSLKSWVSPPGEPGADVRLQLEIRNLSSTPWPAFGFLPRHLVALEGAVVDAKGALAIEPWRVRLNDDLAPNTPLISFVRFEAPRNAGSYSLILRLVQDGSGPLGCVEPLGLPFSIANRSPESGCSLVANAGSSLGSPFGF